MDMNFKDDDKVVKIGKILHYFETRFPDEKICEIRARQGNAPNDLGYKINPEKLKIIIATTRGEFTGDAIIFNGKDMDIVNHIISIPPNLIGERMNAIARILDDTKNYKMYIKLSDKDRSKKIDIDEISSISVEKLKNGWFY